METRNKLRNQLIQKIQKLPSEKLDELSNMIGEIEKNLRSKDFTLSMAGSWQNTDREVFEDLIDNLHERRKMDREL